MTSSIAPGDNSKTDEKLFEEAARWHIRLRDPDASPDVHDGFLLWLRQDPAHLEAYDRAEALWISMRDETSQDAPRDDAAIAALVAEGRSGLGVKPIAGAAAMALVFALCLWNAPEAFDNLRADHIAWTGKRESVVLADGTRVDLNSGTAISVDFDRHERKVRMFRGEAFFDVAHDSAQPFIVQTPAGRILVTGTRFNVDLSGVGADVALYDGSVMLSGHSASSSRAVMSPGQQVTLAADHIGAPEAFDRETRTAWRKGKMVFYRTPLVDVLAELGRYKSGAIMLLNDDAAGLPVTGAFSTENPSQVADIIAETLGLSVHRVANRLTIIR